MRCYLHTDPADDIEELIGQYVEALWVEERTITAMAAAIGKAFSGK